MLLRLHFFLSFFALKKGIVELKELELKWASDEKNVKWKDQEKTLQHFKDELQWAKELQK